MPCCSMSKKLVGVPRLVSGFTWATPTCNPGVPRGYPPTALSQSFSVPRTKTLLGPEVKCLQHLVKSVCHTAAAGRVYRTARMLRILHTPHRPDTLLFLFLPNFQATRQVQTKAIGESFGDTNWCCATGESKSGRANLKYFSRSSGFSQRQFSVTFHSIPQPKQP